MPPAAGYQCAPVGVLETPPVPLSVVSALAPEEVQSVRVCLRLGLSSKSLAALIASYPDGIPLSSSWL